MSNELQKYDAPACGDMTVPGAFPAGLGRRRSTVPTLVHIEDNQQWCEHVALVAAFLLPVRHLGYSTSSADGLALCRARRPSIVLLDLCLPGMDGFDLAERLAALAAGQRFFPPDVRAVVERLRHSPDSPCKILSTREQSLVEDFARGDSDAVIAAKHGVSRHTAHSHRGHIKRKLPAGGLGNLIVRDTKSDSGIRLSPSGG